jgi:hypothetical protein
MIGGIGLGLAGQAFAQAGSGPSAAPSPAAQSKKQPWPLPHEGTARINQAAEKWLSVGGEFRLRVESRANAGFRADNDDTFLLSRLRANVDVHPSPWFRLFVEGQDAQAIGFDARPDPPLFQDRFDLRQAYVELHHRQRGGFGLRLGRQELIFGEERLIGAFDWSNTARTFDAARLFYESKKVRLDVFAAAVVLIEDEVFNKRRKGDHLYGAHATFPTLVPQSRWDVYAFWRARDRVISEQRRAGDVDTVTFGTRLKGKLPRQFDYGLEVAGQTGDSAGDDVGAVAVHTELGYTIAHVKATPRWLIEYNYASGDEDPADGNVGTFDQLFPTNHDKYGVADLVGWRNMHDLRTGISIKPTKDINVTADYHSFWLAERRDAFYNAAGLPVARVATGAAGSHIGQELDFFGLATVAKRYRLGAGFAYMFAGDFLKEATPGRNTSWSYLMFGYRF